MRTSIGFIFIIVLSLLLYGVESAQSRQQKSQQQDETRNSIQNVDDAQRRAIRKKGDKEGFMQDYKLGPGDRLKISVYGEERLSDTYKVDGNGNITLPLIGAMEARGKSVDTLRDFITRKLQQGYMVDPSVTIEITKFRPFYIMGEIRKPGGYEYVDGMSVMNAAAISGGFTYRADKEDIIIIRKQGEKKRRLEVEPDARVMPGDTIKVQERFF